MKQFAALYQSLDETTKSNRKIAAMRDYFAVCSPEDGAWAVHFLSGRRFKRLISTKELRECCLQLSGISGWMFDECYSSVGDLAETIALLLPDQGRHGEGSLTKWIEQDIRALAQMSEGDRRQALAASWAALTGQERFVFNKLVTGSFRVGVAHGMLVRALSQVSGVDTRVIAHRLMGTWEPTAEFYQSLIGPDAGQTDHSKPYPFCLAHPLASKISDLGEISDWLMEWKWDGIRGQLIRRDGQSFLWSRGEEPVLERFPELIGPAAALANGTVLDGEILAWDASGVLPFGEMQRRIGRKTLGAKLLKEVPVRFVAFDLLEEQGLDLRSLPLKERRQRLESSLANAQVEPAIMPSPLVAAATWVELSQQREASRELRVEGVMLKRADSPYSVGRVTGLWWKWKTTAYTVDAVLIYAQRGSGRRASLYTDYTFAAWSDGQLVPFAKAYSGLTDEEIREVDRFIRQHTIEQFGPVRSVLPELVFELAFEGIQLSKRHKSGVAVRFPRIARWRRDKRPEQADSLETLQSLIRQ